MISAAYPNLRGDNRVGDPCPCGCGGSYSLPANPTARRLVISLACQGCGGIRTYSRKSEVHFTFCHSCARRQRSDQEYPDSPSTASFNTALLEALQLKGLSKTQAMDQAGLSTGSLSNWLSGKFPPFRDNLQSLADVLDAPHSLDLIACRIPEILMSCASCGKSKRYVANVIRGSINRGEFDGAVVDYSNGTGTYPKCGQCAMSAVGKDQIR